MSQGLLLDTHTQVWLEGGRILSKHLIARIADAANANKLYVSDYTIWELSVAQSKRSMARRPDLKGLTSGEWVDRFLILYGAQLLALTTKTITEAASLPRMIGYGDPGDCLLIATAHLLDLALVTHDARILHFAANNPTYLTTIPC